MKRAINNKEGKKNIPRFVRRLPVLLILVVGLLLRGAYLFEIRGNPDFAYPSIDASYHDYWARGIVTGGWAVPGGREDPQIYRYPFYRPPGYAYFLAVIYFIFGPGYLIPRVIQMLLGMGSVLLAFFLGKRWSGRTVGSIFALFMAIYWIFIYFEGELVGVSAAVFLGILLITLLARFNRAASVKALRWNSLICGLVLGLFALFRPNVLLFLPVAAAWIIWIARRRKVRRLLLPAFFILGAGLTIAPVTIRNWAVGGEFVPIATNLGVSIRVANNVLTDATTHVIPEIGDIGTPYDWPRIIRHLERRLGRRLTHSEASAYLTGNALRFMKEHPGEFFSLLGRKVLLFWGPSEIRNIKEIHFARLYSPILRAIPGNFPSVLSLFLTGLFLFFLDVRPAARSGDHVIKERFEVAVLILLFIGTYFLSVLPFAAAARYRVPIIPFLLLFGAYGLKRIGEFLVRAEWFRTAFWLGLLAFIYVPVSRNLSGYRPSPEKWHYDRALAYTDQEDWHHAVEEYEKSIEFKPDFVRAYNNLGNICTLLKDYEKAVVYYKRVIQLRPDLAQGYSNLGNVLYHQGNFEGATEYMKKALEVRPDLVEAHNNLGVVLLRQGRTEEAIWHYRQALKYKPADVTARVNLSKALIKEGKSAEAKQILETALRIQPDYEPARRALQRIGDQ